MVIWIQFEPPNILRPRSCRYTGTGPGSLDATARKALAKNNVMVPLSPVR